MSPVATEIEIAWGGHAPPHAIASIYTGNYTTSADANAKSVDLQRQMRSGDTGIPSELHVETKRLITSIPPARNGPLSRVATGQPWAAADSAM
jgi:hypothetical protein